MTTAGRICVPSCSFRTSISKVPIEDKKWKKKKPVLKIVLAKDERSVLSMSVIGDEMLGQSVFSQPSHVPDRVHQKMLPVQNSRTGHLFCFRNLRLKNLSRKLDNLFSENIHERKESRLSPRDAPFCCIQQSNRRRQEETRTVLFCHDGRGEEIFLRALALVQVHKEELYLII